MTSRDSFLQEALTSDRFPRSSEYDARWVLENAMGPHPLWLTEALVTEMHLKAGMRVLDLGCGRAISSIFLAREFDVQVWAADLWISPNENERRIRDAGLGDRIFPMHVEAHDVPFADGFFDAVVSVDAYHYFRTDDLYLGYILRTLQDGGEIGIIVPGLTHELDDAVPPHLAPNWQWDYGSFHSADWWRRHWEISGLVEVEGVSLLPDGRDHWLRWNELCIAVSTEFDWDIEALGSISDLLKADGIPTLSFVAAVATKK